MDNNNLVNWDENKSMMINELTQGRDLVKQLRLHLDPSSASTAELLVSQILSSYDNVFSMLNLRNSLQPEPNHHLTVTGVATAAMRVESPRSVSGSPRSDDSDLMIRDRSKKRKALPRWTEQVNIGTSAGLEAPLDDGYGWRKYGQKDILGAKHPRGYYRCTHRNVQGCPATKQVQRSDSDSSVFTITYRGKHTCTQASHVVSAKRPNTLEIKENQVHQQQDQEQKNPQEILMSFKAGLEVKTENLDSRPEFRCLSFSFPSTSTPMDWNENRNDIFSPMTPENNNLIGDFTPPFISPTTSESNYFSPYRMNTFGGDSDLNEIISAATSGANSPILDLDFPLDQLDFDAHFPFGNRGLFH